MKSLRHLLSILLLFGIFLFLPGYLLLAGEDSLRTSSLAQNDLILLTKSKSETKQTYADCMNGCWRSHDYCKKHQSGEIDCNHQLGQCIEFCESEYDPQSSPTSPSQRAPATGVIKQPPDTGTKTPVQTLDLRSRTQGSKRPDGKHLISQTPQGLRIYARQRSGAIVGWSVHNAQGRKLPLYLFPQGKECWGCIMTKTGQPKPNTPFDKRCQVRLRIASCPK